MPAGDPIPTGIPIQRRDEVIATAAAALVREDKLREAILDIAAHSTAINDSHEDDEWRDGFYVTTIGSVHRALGVVGHSAAPASNAPLPIACPHLGVVQPYAEVFRKFDGKWLWESLCENCFGSAPTGLTELSKKERDQIRNYWTAPTMMARVVESAPGFYEYAQKCINDLCDACDTLELSALTGLTERKLQMARDLLNEFNVDHGHLNDWGVGADIDGIIEILDELILESSSAPTPEMER